MRRTPPAPPTLTPAALERWESWPLWAIGLSNGLNIALWFVLSMVRVEAPELAMHLPPMVERAVPWLIVAGALATALSLDGVLIATIAGVRHGRKSRWSYGTIAGAGLFSALIAYAVHSGVLAQWSWLHVAQALVLVLYNLHLSQPRKDFTGPAGAASALSGWQPAGQPQITTVEPPRLAGEAFPALELTPASETVDVPQQSKLKACKYCGELVTFAESGAHGLYFKHHGRCVA
jgi:MFS family permease